MKERRIINRENKDNKNNKIYFYISLTSSIIFLILVSISHYFAIINGYEWWYWELSELVLYGSLSEILFIIAIVIYSLSLLFVLIPIRRIFSGMITRFIYHFLAFSVSLSLFLVGVITESIFPTTHYIFGAIFFIVTGILILFISIYTLKYLKELPNFYPIFGFITFTILLFHIITRWFFGMSYTQRLAVLFSMIYFLLIGGKLLLNENLVNISEKQMTNENKL
ncbi:MAG: hypothetical protein JXA54_06230 [Candidatus Heimdallarchaeota archaeon]|nr:hypothetical protein [Candidatus Heimdallarchaeota archaeon]